MIRALIRAVLIAAAAGLAVFMLGLLFYEAHKSEPSEKDQSRLITGVCWDV